MLVGFIAISSFVEMIAFHVLWIYRENEHKDNPRQYAVKKEVVNIVSALGFIAMLVGLHILSVKFLNIPILIPVAVLTVLLFFGYSAYKIYAAKIPRESLNTRSDN